MGRIILRSRIISGFINQRLNNGQAIKLKNKQYEKEEQVREKSQVEPEDALRDGALRRCGMEQVSDDVRGIQRVRESRLSQGALLRAEVQGAESGQDVGGLLHQAVGFPCPVPLHRHELQSGR